MTDPEVVEGLAARKRADVDEDDHVRVELWCKGFERPAMRVQFSGTNSRKWSDGGASSTARSVADLSSFMQNRT